MERGCGPLARCAPVPQAPAAVRSVAADSTLQDSMACAASHGGGTVAVESQGSAAAAIVAGETNVAGIGGFSGVESSVSPSWLAMEVRAGRLRWIVADTGGRRCRRRRGRRASPACSAVGLAVPAAARSAASAGSGPGRRRRGGIADGRTGSAKAFAIAEKVGRKVTITVDGQSVTMYDLQGKASAILAASR